MHKPATVQGKNFFSAVKLPFYIIFSLSLFRYWCPKLIKIGYGQGRSGRRNVNAIERSKCVVSQASNNNVAKTAKFPLSAKKNMRRKYFVVYSDSLSVKHIQSAFMMLFKSSKSPNVFFSFVLLHIQIHTTAELRVKCFVFLFLLTFLVLFLFRSNETIVCVIVLKIRIKGCMLWSGRWY